MSDNSSRLFNINSFSPFLILLIPIFLISGPFLTDLSIVLSSILFFFFVNKKKYYFNYFLIFFLLFCLILLLSSLLNFNFSNLKTSLFYFRFGFFSLFFWYLIDKDINILKHLLYVILFSFLILIFDSFFQFLNGENIFGMKLIYENRVSSFFGDELKMGSYLFRLFPLVVSLCLFYYNDKLHKQYIPIFIIFIILVYISIYLSGERTSFFMFNFTILLFVLFLKNFRFIKLAFFLLYLLITLILTISDNPFKKRLIDLTINDLKLDSNKSNIILFSTQYSEHYISAWRIFKDNKIIGIGPKNFRNICKEDKYYLSENTCSTHPHNVLLQILSELGLIGFLFYFLLFFKIWHLLFSDFFKTNKNKKQKIENYQISLLIYLAISLWPLAPSGNIFNNWLSAVYYFPVGIILWSFKNNINYENKAILNNKFINFLR